jgi:hypothetical protein
MKLTTHILSPNNTGAPDYDICSQGASVVSFVNTSLKITITDGVTGILIVNTTDLSGAPFINVGSAPIGDFTVDVVSLVKNSLTGSVSLQIDLYNLNTTDVKTWDKIYITIEVSKSGYQPYINTFEIYGYDIGNDTTLGYSGNPDFDIYLVNNANNLDVNGKQTKAFSNFSILRQPFTDNIYLYNMVGTQGLVEYFTDSGVLLGSGSSTKVCVTANLCNDNSAIFKEKITVFDGTTVLDVCEYGRTATTVKWLPTVTSTSSCPTACNDCINNLSPVIVSTTVDYEGVTPFKINNVLVFLTEFMVEETTFKLYDFQNIEIDSVTIPYIITYAAWITNKALFLVPVEYTVTAPPLGDTKIVITHTFSYLNVLFIACNDTIAFKTCYWWTVSKGLECGSYIFNNCSSDTIDIVLQKFNSDKTFTDILTITVAPFSNADISLQVDGVYMIKVPSRDIPGQFEYYSIVNFCGIEACWLNFLHHSICCKPDDDCKVCDNYKFHAFLINAHTFFMAINEEFNFSFIYTVIDDERIKNLYTLDSFIIRFTEYCGESCEPCKEC